MLIKREENYIIVSIKVNNNRENENAIIKRGGEMQLSKSDIMSGEKRESHTNIIKQNR